HSKSSYRCQNLAHFQLEDVTISWPNEPVPEDWKVPVRIINGDFNRKFRYDYAQPKQTELGVVWGENLNGGKLIIPDALPSASKTKAVSLTSSTIQTN
ncbi:MAG: hypothetical protein HRU12_08030, partial [Phaeodactylibacter sp.]|nr:hypothetical protein [Phaeodactylibacter sp.]